MAVLLSGVMLAVAGLLRTRLSVESVQDAAARAYVLTRDLRHPDAPLPRAAYMGQLVGRIDRA